MTENVEEIDWQVAMNIIKNISPYVDGIQNNKLNKKKNITTRDLFSMMIPNDINLLIRNEEKTVLEIKKGKLIEGVIDKTILNGVIMNYIIDKYGFKNARIFMDNIQRVVVNWLYYKGFSAGIKDGYIKNKDVMNEIKTLLEKKELKAKCNITELENNPELIDPISFENNLQNEL
jgi:hypothetical protein